MPVRNRIGARIRRDPVRSDPSPPRPYGTPRPSAAALRRHRCGRAAAIDRVPSGRVSSRPSSLAVGLESRGSVGHASSWLSSRTRLPTRTRLDSDDSSRELRQRGARARQSCRALTARRAPRSAYSASARSLPKAARPLRGTSRQATLPRDTFQPATGVAASCAAASRNPRRHRDRSSGRFRRSDPRAGRRAPSLQISRPLGLQIKTPVPGTQLESSAGAPARARLERRATLAHRPQGPTIWPRSPTATSLPSSMVWSASRSTGSRSATREKGGPLW